MRTRGTRPSLPNAVELRERRLSEETLRKSGGNKQKAAQALCLSRQGLIKKSKMLRSDEFFSDWVLICKRSDLT